MNRVPVQSSQIASIGYDPAESVLEIEFRARGKGPPKPNAIYQYASVPPDTHAALLSAESVGKAFGELIRSKPETHPHTKIQ